MAAIRLTCRSCEAKIKTSAEPGAAVKCPRCGKSTRVPEPEPEDDFENADEEEEEPAPKRRRAVAAPNVKRPRDEDEPDEDEEEDERPRARDKGRKKEKAGPPVLLWIGLGGGGLVLVAGVVLAVVLLLPGKNKDQGKGPGGVVEQPKPKYASPDEVFAAFVDATKRQDGKAFVNCLAPESRRQMAGEQALLAYEVRRGNEMAGNPIKLSAGSAALDRHGLTPEATKDVEKLTGSTAKINALLALVKDPDALLADLLDAHEQDLPTPKWKREAPLPTLKDVKVNGDKATGTAVTDLGPGNGQKEGTINFVRIDGGWTILMKN